MNTDAPPEPGVIHMPNLADMGPGRSAPDFSYLMILELKCFYKAKFRAFRKCAQTCEELCDCAYQLCEDLGPSLKTVDDHYYCIRDMFTERTRIYH